MLFHLVCLKKHNRESNPGLPISLLVLLALVSTIVAKSLKGSLRELNKNCVEATDCQGSVAVE